MLVYYLWQWISVVKSLNHIRESSSGDEIVFCFHDNHFLKVKEAKQKILEQLNLIIGLDEEKIRPIAPLRCSIEGCSHKLESSWLFNEEIKRVRMLHDKIDLLSRQEIHNDVKNSIRVYRKRVWWFHCSCQNLFFHEIGENCIISCPKCSKVYELA